MVSFREYAITTLLALFALYLFGGTALQGFSFALIWGVVIGTYSSVYVAGALLAMLPNPREGLLLDTKKDVNTNKTVI
jgi:preprotein translocase subunit SecF